MGPDSDGSRTRGPLPRDPHRLGAEENAAADRERLIGAMVELAGERGFWATSVADLIARARVSRKAFYTHFANREELLLAAFESCAAANLAEVRSACEGSNGESPKASSKQRLERLIGRLCGAENERPGTIAMCAREIAASNRRGQELRSELMRSYGALIQASLEADGEAPMPDAFARALAGALHRTIDLDLGAESSMSADELSSALARWAGSYCPFPSSLSLTGDSASFTPPWPWLHSTGLAGGRAPGTLALAADGPGGRGLVPTTLERHTDRERVLDALTQLNAEQGYPGLTAESIAARAELPLGLFRAQFVNRDAAFVAALDLGHMRGLAIVERARAGAASWADGARATTYALLEFLASEPAFAKLALLDALLAGPEIALRAADHLAAYAEVLFAGAGLPPALPRIALSACLNGLIESSYSNISQGRLDGETLILATFFVLAPFIGVAKAAEMSADAGRRD